MINILKNLGNSNIHSFLLPIPPLLLKQVIELIEVIPVSRRIALLEPFYLTRTNTLKNRCFLREKVREENKLWRIKILIEVIKLWI